MRKTFLKNLFRDIKKSLSRFLSIVIIIGVGVAFYAGVRATSPDMKMSGDLYFSKNNLMDFRIISTLGLTRDDVSEISNIPGVTGAEGSYSLDAVIERDGRSQVLNINSLPEKGGINEIKIERGKRPENFNEAIIEDRFLKNEKLKLGDTIALKSGNETKLEDRLNSSRFKIVGTAKSPLYISGQRQLSSIGNGSVRGFVYILPHAFKDEVYTEVYVRTLNDESTNSLLNNEKYSSTMKPIEAALKYIGIKRGEIRYSEVMEKGKDSLNEAEEELSKARLEAEDKFADAYRELDKGRNKILIGSEELNKNAAALKEEEAKVNKKLEESEAEIQENREKLNNIKRPDWYVLGRSTNVGYETYRQDSDRIGNIGKAFPLIFFLVASLVSLTTMTRMVQDKRVEIGTLKAIGYSNTTVVSHYLIYALSASIIGSLIGISIGFRLFPPLIMNAYSSLYSIPYRAAPFNTSIALQASLVAILFVALAASLAAMEELREVPASLMRPKPPKLGKKIFLERVTFIWNRLGFTEKVTARNIFRYKQRLFMTVIGIAACTSLMITGYGIREGITGATKEQFSRIYKYNMQGSLTVNASETEKKDIKQRALLDTNVKSLLFTYSKNALVKMENSKIQDAYLIVPEDKNAIKDYITLTMNGRDIGLNDQGVILTEKLARMINKRVGDTVKITINDKEIEVRVSDITEQYIQHYIYMSLACYESLMDEKLSYNSFYGLLNNTSEDYQNRTSGTLKTIKNINSVGFKNNIQIDYGESMNSVNSVVLVLIVSAGVLAFVVIYNLTNINITERRRELATIKLLGFYNSELAAYIYRENIILTLIGSIAGIFLGKILNRYILLSAETNVIMFLNRIGPIYFLYSVLLTIFFSMVVNLAMYSRFDRIDMIESLKSVE